MTSHYMFYKSNLVFNTIGDNGEIPIPALGSFKDTNLF